MMVNICLLFEQLMFAKQLFIQDYIKMATKYAAVIEKIKKKDEFIVILQPASVFFLSSNSLYRVHKIAFIIINSIRMRNSVIAALPQMDLIQLSEKWLENKLGQNSNDRCYMPQLVQFDEVYYTDHHVLVGCRFFIAF